MRKAIVTQQVASANGRGSAIEYTGQVADPGQVANLAQSIRSNITRFLMGKTGNTFTLMITLEETKRRR